MEQVTTDQVTAMLLESLNLDEEYDADEIEPDGPLFGEDGLDLDSLDALQLAVAIEERWGVTVDENQGEQVFRSVRTIADYVNAHRKG